MGDYDVVFSRARDAIAKAQHLSSEIGRVVSRCRDFCAEAQISVEKGEIINETLLTSKVSEVGDSPVVTQENRGQSPIAEQGSVNDVFCERNLNFGHAQSHECSSQLGPLEILWRVIILRVKQLLIRRAELKSLQIALLSQSSLVAGLRDTGLSNTSTAIESALTLINDSLSNIDCTCELVGKPVETALLCDLIDKASRRASEVFQLVTRLTNILLSLGVHGNESQVDQGVSVECLKHLPVVVCTTEQAANLQHEKCSICWGSFAAGERLSAFKCKHVHHHECLKEWLLVSGCCPLCKLQFRHEEFEPSVERP